MLDSTREIFSTFWFFIENNFHIQFFTRNHALKSATVLLQQDRFFNTIIFMSNSSCQSMHKISFMISKAKFKSAIKWYSSHDAITLAWLRSKLLTYLTKAFIRLHPIWGHIKPENRPIPFREKRCRGLKDARAPFFHYKSFIWQITAGTPKNLRSLLPGLLPLTDRGCRGSTLYFIGQSLLKPEWPSTFLPSPYPGKGSATQSVTTLFKWTKTLEKYSSRSFFCHTLKHIQQNFWRSKIISIK